MKKFLILIITLLSISTTIYAKDVSVQINGEIVDFTDGQGNKVNAQIINERTMVPFRKIFNLLGINDDNIIYTSSEEPIIAKGNGIEIRLVIGNTNATKIVDGITTNITLDSAPVIVEGRTLVPLRFIAESLGHTVGWDSANNTAIIIDYNYFINKLKNKASNLYEFLNNESTQTNFSITRNYYDNEDSSKNDTAIVSGQIIENKTKDSITQNVTVDFSGSNELMKEINSEEWGHIQYENIYSDDSIVSKPLTDGLRKLYGTDQITFEHNELNCKGNYNDSLYELFKTICSVNDTSINISTFEDLNNDFDNLLKLFNVNGSKLYTGDLNSNDIDLKYFDFTKFDNINWNDSVSRVYNFLNSQLFKYDMKLDEMSYDYPTINMEITSSEMELTISLVGLNQYNEKVEYIIKINKN